MSMPPQYSSGNQQSYPPQGQGHDPNRYDFFLSPQQPQKSSWLPGSGSPMLKLALLLGGLIVVMIVLAVVFNALFGTKLNTQQIISIAQKQQEIARISKNAKTKATSLAVKNIAVTSETSLLSSQYELTEFMQSKGKKVDQDALTTSQSKTNDDKLATAEATGTYNRTYVELLDEQLQAYQTALQQAYNAADSKSLKTILSNEFKSASTLQAQVAEAQKHL